MAYSGKLLCYFCKVRPACARSFFSSQIPLRKKLRPKKVCELRIQLCRCNGSKTPQKVCCSCKDTALPRRSFLSPARGRRRRERGLQIVFGVGGDRVLGQRCDSKMRWLSLGSSRSQAKPKSYILREIISLFISVLRLMAVNATSHLGLLASWSGAYHSIKFVVGTVIGKSMISYIQWNYISNFAFAIKDGRLHCPSITTVILFNSGLTALKHPKYPMYK